MDGTASVSDVMGSESVSAESDPADLAPDSGIGRRHVVLVMLVGADFALRATAASAVEGKADLELSMQPDWAAARRVLRSTSRSVIVMVDASQLDGTPLSAFLAPSRLARVHVMALSGADRSRGAPASADEVLRRPVRVDDLATRLRLAARVLARHHDAEPRTRLLEVLAHARSGELVVAAGEDLARIHVDGGRIAWVHRPRHRPSVRDILELDATVDDATIGAIVEQSYASRRHFADVAVELGVRTQAEVRASLVRHLTRELGAVLGWTEAKATFIEEQRPSRATFDFDAAELMARETPAAGKTGWPALSDLPPAPLESVEPALAGVNALVDRIAAVADVSGCIALDARGGVELAARGSLCGPGELVWELASGFIALGAGATEMLATRQGAAFLVRRVAIDSPVIAIVEFDPNAMLPGMARVLVNDVMDR